MHNSQYSRQLYQHLLCQPIGNKEFYIRIAGLLDRDPYFFPAYLDMLWGAEEQGDSHIYEQILHDSLSAIQVIFQNEALRREIEVNYSEKEISALLEILKLAQKSNKYSLPKKFVLYVQRHFAHAILKPSVIRAPQDSKHLKLICRISYERERREIDALASYWWQIDTERRNKIMHHQHTWSLLLRTCVRKEKEYSAHDGVHESIVSQYTERFPNLHNLVLNFASQLNVGLGRVAIILLEPYKQVYRHYDSEEHLVGRNRYHFVLKAGNENILESGNETVCAREGELWFFDNKVLHRAHNKSSIPRIHIIFDGYSLKKS